MMLSSGLPPVLLVLSVLELSWCLSDEEKKIIVDEHNKYRSQVSPPAQAMMKMTWDTDLEVDAQRHAEKCKWGQNGGPGRLNLFAIPSTLDVKFAIEGWNSERKFFNLTTSECVPVHSCDNYVQVIWAATTRVGCGSNYCEKINGMEGENLHLLVCNYYPPSKIKENRAYREGPSCKLCPRGTVCVNNLCAKPGTNSDPPKGGAPSTCLDLSLFLLPSAILVGLLL
ncbi:peptidase inhibitor 16 [Agelaius tricolor]|uniref:peptidase inhibitor 16 n=1 Tax=Agelaius tricolor TaxID=9191 RepID=UPI0039F2476D